MIGAVAFTTGVACGVIALVTMVVETVANSQPGAKIRSIPTVLLIGMWACFMIAIVASGFE